VNVAIVLPPDLHILDGAALAWLLIVWTGYNLAIDRRIGRVRGLNHDLRALRRRWFRLISARPDRITDVTLLGHTMRNVGFFASATLIVLAGLIGLLGGIDRAYEASQSLYLLAKTSPVLFQLKVFLLIGIFVYAFFRFTWSLRQYNYACVLLGAIPDGPDATEGSAEQADAAAEVLSRAVISFNGGLRAFYFVLAVLGWFVHPLALVAATTAVLFMLLRRQFFSHTADAVHRHLAAASEPKDRA
jgi:uncharacterized membrane protein